MRKTGLRWFAIIRAPNGDAMTWTKATNEAKAVANAELGDWDYAQRNGYRLDYTLESLDEDAPVPVNVAGRITHGRGARWA